MQQVVKSRVGAIGGGHRAFTLVEMMFSIAVIILLIGMLIVGLQVATRVSRKAVEQQNVASLIIGVEQFKHDFGFPPPLIQDADPDAPNFKTPTDQREGPISKIHPGSPQDQSFDPVAFLSTTDMALRFPREEVYLRGRTQGNEQVQIKADYRYSTYSLAYYLLGSLGPDPGDPQNQPPVDGVDGAGFLAPNRDGTFRKTGGKQYQPLFDTSKGTKGVVPVDAAKGKFELRDRRNVPYRYYVWRHGRQYNGPGQPAEVREPADLNVPRILGDPAEDAKLRNAEYAIVAAGANGVFGDWWGPNLPDGTETPTEIKEGLGVSQGMSDDRAARMGREDNIVGVGR